MEQTDLIPMQFLVERYNIKRPGLYGRFEKLGIEPVKIGRNAFVTVADMEKLDAAQEYVEAGGSLTHLAKGSRIHEPSEITSIQPKSSGQTESLMLLAEAFAEITKPDFNQAMLHRLDLLQKASEQGWQFSSSELAQMLGVSRAMITKHQTFERHGFTFAHVAKQGREWLWQVSKV